MKGHRVRSGKKSGILRYRRGRHNFLRRAMNKALWRSVGHLMIKAYRHFYVGEGCLARIKIASLPQARTPANVLMLT